MKVSEQFKSTIKAYLDNMAAVDSLFAPVYQKPTKNIDNCITYILNQVKKSGCCGFSDDEIFGMALHYYQEDNIEVGSPLKCNVVVNHHVELSEEEKKAAREAAIKKLQDAVDGEVGVADELTGLTAGHRKAHAIDDVVQTALDGDEQVVTGLAGSRSGLLIVIMELLFQDTVDELDLLLLSKLDAILALFSLHLAAGVAVRGLLRITHNGRRNA